MKKKLLFLLVAAVLLVGCGNKETQNAEGNTQTETESETLGQNTETEDMVSVWVEGSNCGQEGIGTCGTINCTQTCLRSQTLQALYNIPIERGWRGYVSGEAESINWNGKLLVKWYCLKDER